MTKPIKQRFYVDLEYDTEAIPKKEMTKLLKNILVEAVDLNTVAYLPFKSTRGLVVSAEPLQVRVQRQAMENSEVRSFVRDAIKYRQSLAK